MFVLGLGIRVFSGLFQYMQAQEEVDMVLQFQ